MRRTLALATILGACWAALAAADGGGPSPGLDYGNGVVAPGGKLRYLALTNQRTTLLESVVVRSGKVSGARYFKGAFGIPLVTYGGETGGLARNGRRLVLATAPGVSKVTRFLVVDPRRFRLVDRLKLQGTYAFDALSPDGSIMYLLQYMGSPTATGQRYAVRAFNWKTKTLYPGSIVDRREPDEAMSGQPLRRATSRDGVSVYTLYGRPEGGAFVHALDTVHRRARCIDLPWDGVGALALPGLGFRLTGHRLVLTQRRAPIATVDTRTFRVRSYRLPLEASPLIPR